MYVHLYMYVPACDKIHIELKYIRRQIWVKYDSNVAFFGS
jgi:hypothetical protein